MVKRTMVLLLLLVLAGVGRAQETIATAETKVDSVAVVAPQHSPTKALLWSLIPGGGQIYNGQAWKLPIIYGVIGGLGYLAVSNYNSMKMFKDDYLHRVQHGGEWTIEKYASYPNSSIYNLYQQHNKNFQLFVMLTAVAYTLNLIDAYVFGHLYDFQMDDNLTFRIEPSVVPVMNGGGSFAPTVGFTFRF